MARMNTVLELGAGIVANSAATLSDLGTYASAQGHAMPPAVVAHLAPARLRPAAVPPPTQPYFVMLGTIEPRKNHWLMLQLWRQLIAERGDAAPKLVIIGQRGWECENVVDLLERCEALKGHVQEISNCSDTDLATWLKGARALLFPTFAEGYGMPIVEALTLGVPVIASDLPVFREIAGDIPEYVNPLDGMRWRALIESYAAADSAAARQQCERMRSFSPPTWKAHFAQVESLMERLNVEAR
jgi:glycosyltransferase involved in cell wall biosynthesis